MDNIWSEVIGLGQHPDGRAATAKQLKENGNYDMVLTVEAFYDHPQRVLKVSAVADLKGYSASDQEWREAKPTRYGSAWQRLPWASRPSKYSGATWR